MNTDETNPSSVPGKEAPVKYVRTFAGDMAMLKKGGEPDLAPLKEPEPAVVITEKVEAPVPAPVTVPEVEQSAVEAPEAVRVEAPTVSISAPIQEIPEPLIQSAAESAVTLPPTVKEEENSPIKTYTDDFSKRLKETKASTATLLAAEQDSTQQAPELFAQDETKHGNRWYIAAGIFLFLVGGVGIYAGYSWYVATTSPVATVLGVSSPIFVDSSEVISGTGTALVSALQQSVAKPLPSNAVRLVALDVSKIANTSVFAALGLRAPDEILRNVNPVGSMAGVVNTISGQSPFFILSVGSYGVTFSGMLSWEPSMVSSLAVLFPAYPAPAIPKALAVPVPTATTTSAKATRTSTTSTTTAVAAPVVVPPLPSISFSDEVVSNHDVRIYRDAAGRSVLLYGYWNQSTLIIARDPAAFTEILRRLATPHS